MLMQLLYRRVLRVLCFLDFACDFYNIHVPVPVAAALPPRAASWLALLQPYTVQATQHLLSKSHKWTQQSQMDKMDRCCVLSK